MSGNATKYFFRQRQQNRLYDTVIHTIEEAAEREHLRRLDIAERLGIPPSQVTRLLSGPANWTSDTISDLLFAVGAELDFEAVYFRDRVRGNRFHPAGEKTLPVVIGGQTGTTSSRSVTIYAQSPYDPTKPGEVRWIVQSPLSEWPHA